MKISSKVNQYVKNGNSIFVYELDCNDVELTEYKTAQSSYYKESDNKKPLYFSQRICNNGDMLMLTSSGRYQVLQDLEAKAISIDSAKNQNLGKFLALAEFTGLSKAQLAERLLERI